MEKRDYLMGQIEQTGKALANLLPDFLLLKSKGQISQGIEITEARLQNELDIDIEKIISLRKDELKILLNNRLLITKHLKILSDCLKERSTTELERNKTKAKQFLTKALELSDIADKISETIYFERISKKAESKKLIANC